jgi:peptide/nickel transport system permease protein
MGVNLMVGAVVIGANLLTDLVYCVIDPRISYR